MATTETKPSKSKEPETAGRWDRFADPDARGALPFVGIVVTLVVWFWATHPVDGSIGPVPVEGSIGPVVIDLSTAFPTEPGDALAHFSPVAAFPALYELLTSPAFFTEHVLASMVRFGGAFALCLAVGIPLGIALGYFDTAERLSSVSFQFLRMVSPIAWFPVALMVFESGGHAAPIFIIFMGGVWPLMYNTAHGIQTIDKDWLKVADSLGGGTRRKIQKVVIPGVVPEMLSGLRLSIGWMWILLVPAEFLGVSSGMGYFILNARQQFSYADVPAVMIIIGIIGYFLDLGVRKLQARWSWQ